MKKLIIIAALALISTLPVQAVTFQELNPYNGYMQIPNTYGYLEAMGALGNAQRTGKYTLKHKTNKK